MRTIKTISAFLLRAWSRALLVLAVASSAVAVAGTTDIAQAPLITSATSAVLPNLIFVLDDSGSMTWDYLPDWANDNFCKQTNGSYSGYCCADDSNNQLSTSTSPACWTGTAPFGTYRGMPPFLTADFNAVYYNPTITYAPPLNADGTRKPSQTSWTSVKDDAYNKQSTTSTNLLTSFPDLEWCTNNNYTDCLRNDNYILPGTVNGKNYTTRRATTASGTGSVATGSPTAANATTAARTFGPHFYTIIPGEYCDSPNLRNCQQTADATFSYPAPLRWCSSTAATTAATANPSGSATLCQAVKTGTFQYARYPTKFFTPGVSAVAPVAAVTPAAAVPASVTFTVNFTSCTNSKVVTVTSLKIGNTSILSGAVTNAADKNTLTANIRGKIGSAYTVTGSNNSITLTQATPSNSTSSVALVTGTTGASGSCGSVTLSPGTPALSGYTPAVTGVTGSPGSPAVPPSYPGSFVRVDIIPGITSYPLPGTAAKAGTRTDCSGATCSYTEEMTNFANWWTYYHTRMQMMKSSASIAFNPLDTRYRVGYMSINNNTSSDFLNIDNFSTTQKANWYAKLVGAIPGNSTPLRSALTATGRLFAGKLSSLNGVTVKDPMQYSCQQNFTILSTDGYWNESNPGGYQVNGSTAVGDQDSGLQRPQRDGNSTSNTLSDVAAYYYNTDLRTSALGNCTGSPVPPSTTGNDVCANNVPSSGLDAAANQHMTTFTVGLGASGYMQFSPSYMTATTGDFFDITNGTSANPAGGVCSWQTSGACNWPIPVSNTQTTIDDLWHAAVNGYGTYFSASTPSALSTGLSTALAGVAARTGDSAAATTSNPNVATGDNFVFSSTFTSVEWDGQLVRQQLDLVTGAVSATQDWAAQTLLDNNASRAIYTYDPAASNRLKDFTWANLTAEAASFTSPGISTLSQFCSVGPTCLSAASQTAASGSNLVAFLRGDRTNEGVSTDISKYYRQRAHVLGDIVNSEAVYIKAPPYNYTDSGYGTYQATPRTGMVYVGANDGMLHAFNATTGVEVWAYVPSLVIPNLYKLADKNYQSGHSYFVDGTPVQGDVYFGGSWHTILVGGLNGGGRGYYALDVTDPAAPKALWEFTSDTAKGSGYTTDANLGYSFGKPEITKLKNGTWVVLLTSGYNNVSPGDGKGYLYVLNAGTGAKIGSPIATNTGSAGTPSGLAQIRTWTDNGMYDNTALRAYGGDLLGNLWRFDIDDNILPAGNEAQLLATVQNAANTIQPITVKPELGEVNGVAVVYFGTGRYLGVSDLSDNSGQTLYAVKDTLGTTSFGNPRASSHFIQQTLTDTTCPANSPATICSPGQTVRTSTNLAVSFATDYGWYVDLLDTGERSVTDPQLQLGTLGYTTNVLNASACTVGGYSFLYFFDYRNGSAVSTSTTGVVATKLGNALATRPVFARLPNNKVIAIVRLSDGTTLVPPVPIGNLATSTRRVSWRELNN